MTPDLPTILTICARVIAHMPDLWARIYLFVTAEFLSWVVHHSGGRLFEDGSMLYSDGGSFCHSFLQWGCG